jgi:TolB-like protein
LSACASGEKLPDTKPGISGTETLLVLPFRNLNEQNGETGLIRCPGCGTAFATGQVSQSASQLLTEHLLSFLNDNRHFKVIASRPAITVQSESFAVNHRRVAEQQALISAGRAAKAELVLAGYIFRFKQRVGTNYSVQTPASVAFGIHVISVSDSSVVWYGHHDETQQSLSENLFNLKKFLKRRWKWITAEELATSALEELLETFPGS